MRKVPTHDPACRKCRVLRLILGVSSIVVAVVVLGALYGPTGVVSGIEFSPDLFSHRSFRYWQWGGFHITPRWTNQWHSHVDEYLHKNGYVTPPNIGHPRWRHVKGRAPGVRGWSGDAKWMCQSVGCYSGDDKWVSWSQDHPNEAQIVWPQVIAWARNDQYGEICALFRFTDLEEAESAQEIREKIKLAEMMEEE